MTLLRKIWNDFKTQPDVWFFYGFLATFTLSVRKVLFSYPINGQFNEYAGVYLYLSDLFFILIIASWFISILCNKQSFLSIIKSTNVPRGTFLLPLFFVIWSFISINWSADPELALFKSIKLLEYCILFLYLIIKIVPRASRQMFHVEHLSNIISANCSTWNNLSKIRHSDWDGTILRNAFKIIISIGLIQALIAIWQFLTQQSIGLFWLKESLISPDLAGVAKVIFDQEKIIRAYGLFPHPNILGGFLLLSIIITLAYQKMFHVEQSTHTIEPKCSTWNNSRCEIHKPVKNVPRGTFLSDIFKAISDRTYLTILVVQIVALILTFSKSAILGLIIAVSYAYWANIKTYAVKMFHVEHIGRKLIIILSIIIALVIIIKPDIDSLLFKSLDERMLYLNVSRGTISDNTILGVGAGQFVLTMRIYTNQALSDWQFQPVHNVFLLIWSELGLIGLGLFSWMLWKMFHVEQSTHTTKPKCSTWNNSHCEIYEPAKNVPRGTFPLIAIRLFRGLFLGLIFVLLFDHYLWDIQQGEVLFWLALAFLTII